VLCHVHVMLLHGAQGMGVPAAVYHTTAVASSPIAKQSHAADAAPVLHAARVQNNSCWHLWLLDSGSQLIAMACSWSVLDLHLPTSVLPDAQVCRGISCAVVHPHVSDLPTGSNLHVVHAGVEVHPVERQSSDQ
jgi:hypothetical protein